MNTLFKITEFDDLNQINFSLGLSIKKFKDIIEKGNDNEDVIEDAKNQLVIFKSIKEKTLLAINEYLKA